MTDNIATLQDTATGKQKLDARNKPKYATLKNPTIEAIIGEHFRFSTPEQAQVRLESLRETFIVSKLPENVDGNPLELKLWIRGYGLTAESREAGYIGNYAKFEVKPIEKGKWTIAPILLPIDKKYHPQRRQTPKRHPNWGHPIMRDIQKGRVHKTVESAQNELVRLHEAFPEVSIPLTNKMYIMVYRKVKEEGKPPIEKWVLEIKALDSGGFKIDYALNTYKADVRQKVAENKPEPVVSGAVGKPKTAAPTPKNEAVGKFTSQVLLKQSKKKSPLAPKPKPTAEN
jgi:hypothetical protein